MIPEINKKELILINELSSRKYSGNSISSAANIEEYAKLKEIKIKLKEIADYFKEKYIENDGDGIYSAHQTVNNEPCFKNSNIGQGEVPTAEKLQSELMLFTTNQKNDEERKTQINALEKTLHYFS